MAEIFVGTSGFSYPHWGKGLFYPQDLPKTKWFEYYCQYFKTVELNVSFYRLPKKETFEGWRKRAGKDFVFSVKGSRYITHIKKLKDCEEPVKRFFENASGIKNGDDIVLWQLPPRFKANLKRLNQFLKILPKNWRYAFEFRDESWLTGNVYKILKKHKAAIVFQDNPGWPITEEVTTDFFTTVSSRSFRREVGSEAQLPMKVGSSNKNLAFGKNLVSRYARNTGVRSRPQGGFIYIRFHGKTHLYSSCYTENDLKNWAKKIRSWQKRGLDCYTYFNNDALGYAVENAQTLKKLCSKKS